MKMYKKVLIAMMAVLFMVPASVAVPVSAPVSAQGTQRGGSGLSLSPTSFDFNIERGEAALATIQVKNITDDDVIARAFLNDFEPEGNTGNPKLIIDSREQSASSIRDFVVGLEDVAIAAGETAIVNLPLQVPDNAAPGAYYGAVRFTGVLDDGESGDEGQLALNASVAALILIQVPGNITEKIEITKASAFLDDGTGSLFTRAPNEIGIEISNLGNGFSEPFGDVTVNGPWGSGEVFAYQFNDSAPRGKILPESIRLFKKDLYNVESKIVNGNEETTNKSPITWPGKYTINGSISHGSGGEILAVSASFWFLPSWFLITLLVASVVLVGVILYMVRKYGSPKRSKSRR